MADGGAIRRAGHGDQPSYSPRHARRGHASSSSSLTCAVSCDVPEPSASAPPPARRLATVGAHVPSRRRHSHSLEGGSCGGALLGVGVLPPVLSAAAAPVTSFMSVPTGDAASAASFEGMRGVNPGAASGSQRWPKR